MTDGAFFFSTINGLRGFVMTKTNIVTRVGKMIRLLVVERNVSLKLM